MSLRDQDGGRLGELLGHWVEQRLVHGADMDPEELCRDDPTLLGPLRDHIREYEELDRRLAAPQGLASRRLLHYRIVAKLGAGGMGQVFAAEDTKLRRRVALKVLPPEMAADRERLERFRREARTVAALNHPNIVTLFSLEKAGGVHFLAMELVAGKTLDALIPPGGLEQGRILDLAAQLVDALAAAHERGIVHRDLKPANVMVDADGRLKVLDFGLAKLRAPPAESGEGTDSARNLTMEGKILGTLPYMAPEQLLGQAVDPRTDLFSLGVILYEMATGARPFRGDSNAELISSILRDTPVPLTEVQQELPPGLAGIVMRCLEKEPERRFQTALEVREELRQLARQAEGSQPPAETSLATAPLARPTARRRTATIAAAVALAVLSIAWGWRSYLESGRPATGAGSARPDAAARQPAGRTSLAVLYFKNLNGDSQLDWLSSGITEMLVTDLAQSPEIEVLSTSRLLQVMKDLDAVELTDLSRELIRKVGSQAGVETVVRGSYVRLGDVIRIAFTVEGAADGATLTSKHVEGRGEEVFAMVDELAAAIRNNFEIERPAESPASVTAVTTSSLEAWRLYTEARVLSFQSKRMEAIALLEKAVELDPTFALALVYLGTLHLNLGHTAEAREYGRRAFELADRLPLDQRFRIEGSFYSTWSTYGRGIEACRKGLKLHPDWVDLRGQLAYDYAYLERYDEAIEELKRLMADVKDYPGIYKLAADVYAATGRFETGYRLLADVANRQTNWSLELKLGWLLTEWGRLEEAARHLERAAELRPSDFEVPYGQWRLQVRREDWELADAAATRLAGFASPNGRWRGAVSRARNLTYRGRTGEALVRFDEAIRALPAVGDFGALARCWKAELLLQRGEAAEALAEARLAQQEGRGEFPELKGLALAALAEQRLGRAAAAAASEDTLRERWRSRPNKVEERQLLHLAGLLALDRGDVEDAVRALERAESLLAPKGIEIHWQVYPDHVPVWYALGEAELAAGRDQRARRWFEKVANASEHVEQPVPYVRSFYFLGRIHQRSGETFEARRSFERFLRYWQEGDIDRERVEEAVRAVGDPIAHPPGGGGGGSGEVGLGPTFAR